MLTICQGDVAAAELRSAPGGTLVAPPRSLTSREGQAYSGYSSTEQRGERRMDRRRRRPRDGLASWSWPVVVAVCLFCIAFWTAADLFHEEEGIESDPGCPICQLERIAGSGAPTEAAVVLGPQAVLLDGVVESTTPGICVVHPLGPAAPRGPPLPA